MLSPFEKRIRDRIIGNLIAGIVVVAIALIIYLLSFL